MLDDYLPNTITNAAIKDFAKAEDIPLRLAKSELQAKYKQELKAGLQEAIGDYMMSPSDHQELLPEILSILIDYM